MLAGEMKKFNNKLMPFVFVWILFGLMLSTSWAAASDDKDIGSEVDPPPGIEEKWGVKILPIRLTAAGKMLDFRFRVVDSDKAMALMQRGEKAHLIDQATGRKLPVPRTKVGPMRQTGSKPKKGSVYPILFINLGRVVKPGSKVTVVLGDFRLENIVVESATPYQNKLPKPKQTQWETVQKSLREELGNCTKDCGQDRQCFDKCYKAHKSRMDKEYQKLLNEK
jgi:hypothetical protein